MREQRRDGEHGLEAAQHDGHDERLADRGLHRQHGQVLAWDTEAEEQLLHVQYITMAMVTKNNLLSARVSSGYSAGCR